MGIGEWLADNWFDLLTNAGTIGGIFFAAFSLYEESKARRVANLIALTQSHREIWKRFYENADVSRVVDPQADVSADSISPAERYFVIVVIQHLASVYQAKRKGLTIKPEGLRQDVRAFFRLPVPRAVWKKCKPVQDDDFVAFVEECLSR